uniref:MATE family efflux transporter n=1 Tax=Alloprevotella sp. TaxID=1872471 RepID=UPI00402941A3
MSEKTSESAMSGVDMLHGPLLLKILWFSLPLAASSLFEFLFNSVFMFFFCHFVGSNALAAVGSNAPVIGLLINLFMGISMGANAVISTLIGQRDHTRIRHAVSTVAVVALVSGFALMVLGTSLARPILSAMSTPPEVLDMAILYLRIYFLGMPFFMIYVFGAAILRSKGDTRRPLYILIVAGIANHLLNLRFVLLFHKYVALVAC